MTPTDVVFRYGSAPGIREIRALDSVREVYGIRRITFDEKERTVRVEYDASRLLCQHSRIVTDRGVSVCPILIEAPDARLGGTLAESWRPYPLRHQACSTCYQYGALCANPSGAWRDA